MSYWVVKTEEGMDQPLTRADSFTQFVREHETPLRHALIAECGGERGREAAADAFAYGWEHWDRVAGLANPVGYLALDEMSSGNAETLRGSACGPNPTTGAE